MTDFQSMAGQWDENLARLKEKTKDRKKIKMKGNWLNTLWGGKT